VLAPVGSVTARQTAANTVSGIVYENRSVPERAKPTIPA